MPWRAANSTRTAHRDDLLRMLAPLTKKPSIDVVSTALQLPVEKSVPKGMILTMDLYFVPAQGSRLVYPIRLIDCIVKPFDSLIDRVGIIRFEPEESADSKTRNRSTRHETIIEDPGLFRFQVFADFSDFDIQIPEAAYVSVTFQDAYSKTKHSIATSLSRLNPGQDAPFYGRAAKATYLPERSPVVKSNLNRFAPFLTSLRPDNRS